MKIFRTVALVLVMLGVLACIAAAAIFIWIGESELMFQLFGTGVLVIFVGMIMGFINIMIED